MKLVCLILFVATLSACSNECRDIECVSEYELTFQIKDYSVVEIQDTLLRVLYRDRSHNPFISKGTGQFYVPVYGSGEGEFSIFYNDTLKAVATFSLRPEEGECCNFFTPTEFKINGEVKCTDCNKSEVFEIEI